MKADVALGIAVQLFPRPTHSIWVMPIMKFGDYLLFTTVFSNACLSAAHFFLNHTLQINIFSIVLKIMIDQGQSFHPVQAVEQLHEYAGLEYEVFKISMVWHQYHL